MNSDISESSIQPTESGTPPGQPSLNRAVKANNGSVAARYNLKVLRSLHRELQKNPEADITKLLGSPYSNKLQSFKQVIGHVKSKTSFKEDDIRSRIDATSASAILCPLSLELEDLVQPSKGLSASLVHLLTQSEVLYRSPWAASIMVFRLSREIVVKITANKEDVLTEHQSLSWLQTHQPSFPAPRPHGVISMGQFYMLFTSFISGQTLEDAWSRLDQNDKVAVKGQLEILIAALRRIPCPDSLQLGGVQGSGCKDMRRGTRFSSEPILSVQQFEEFMFAGSKTALPIYTSLLRNLMPTSTAPCVFTHGDLRPANIIVSQTSNQTWKVIGIIDWESSGFYPEYWDCVKATNNLTPREQFDWYMFLPSQISPSCHPIEWLVDRIWDPSLDHS